MNEASPGNARRQIILGASAIRSFLRPFQNFEEERAYYQHCLAYEGDHGVPANEQLKPGRRMDALRAYLILKLEDVFRLSGPPPEFVCTSTATLEADEQARLERFNAWLPTLRAE